MAAGAGRRHGLLQRFAMAIGLSEDPTTTLARSLKLAALSFDSAEVHRLIDDENADVSIELFAIAVATALSYDDTATPPAFFHEKIIPTLYSLLRAINTPETDTELDLLKLLFKYHERSNNHICIEILQKLLIERHFNFNELITTDYEDSDISSLLRIRHSRLPLETEISPLTLLILSMYEKICNDIMMLQGLSSREAIDLLAPTSFDEKDLKFLELLISPLFNARIPEDELRFLCNLSDQLGFHPEIFVKLYDRYRNVIPSIWITQVTYRSTEHGNVAIQNPDGEVCLGTEIRTSVVEEEVAIKIIPKTHRSETASTLVSLPAQSLVFATRTLAASSVSATSTLGAFG